VKFWNGLRRFAVLASAISLTVFSVDGHTKKGDKLLKEGEKAEAQKQYDIALNFYDQALATDPRDPAYLLADQRVRSKAAEGHIAEGKRLQEQQKLDEALVAFQKAFLSDPSSQIAIQEIRLTTAMIKERNKLPAGTPVLTPAERVRQEVERRINSLEGPPKLRPITNQITSLKMNNQPARVLYETVAKLAGINVLFDPQGFETTAGRNFNLELNNVTLDEALNYVALVTHTFWKPISRNAIFVTQESEQKRLEYQDEVVKVFYIQNATTPNEFNEIYNGVRTGAKLTTGLFQVASQNAIVARGSPDTVALVEKLVHDLDKPKAEIVLDVIVMEVDKQRSSTIGAALAGQTGGLNVPISFTPRNSIATSGQSTGSTTGSTGSTTGSTGSTTGSTGSTTGSTGSTTGSTGSTTGSTGDLNGTTGLNTGTTTGNSTSNSILLSKVGHISTSDYSITMPGALIQALMQDANTRVMQRPQIRVTDGGKASLKIGSKIPYVSGSLNSAVATPGAIPYATTQFQEVDVGVNVDLEPHVNGPDDVSMHIKVEISNVTSTETIAGVQQPIIGQRVNEANIRMKDGEVSVLGGLSLTNDQNSISGIPGVANIPVLGYLFGTRVKSHENDDILIALIPHIVRAPDLGVLAEDEVVAGTERVIKVIRRPETAPEATTPVTQPAPVPVPPAPPLTPTPNPARPSAIPPNPAPSSSASPSSANPALQTGPSGSPQDATPQGAEASPKSEHAANDAQTSTPARAGAKAQSRDASAAIAALEKYSDAWNTKDVASITAIRPELARRTVEKELSAARSIFVRIQPTSSPKIEGDHATIDCVQQVDEVFSDGVQKHSPEVKVTYLLANRSGNWLIEGSR